MQSEFEKRNSFFTSLFSVFLRNIFTILAVGFLLVVVFSGVVYAASAPAGPSEALWTDVANLISRWVTRLGAVTMFVGGVLFGVGWSREDAEGKTRGINTLISGAIITGVAALTNRFFFT